MRILRPENSGNFKSIALAPGRFLQWRQADNFLLGLSKIPKLLALENTRYLDPFAII
jgi:hypothetical protein